MVFITRVGNLVVRIHLPRRNVLNSEEWVTSPQIAKRKMKKIVARARSLKERKSYSRSITRRKMARLAMLSWIRVQVRTPILMMMMLNPPRRVVPVLPSRRLHLFLTHLIASEGM
jgi:hypothetical protein